MENKITAIVMILAITIILNVLMFLMDQYLSPKNSTLLKILFLIGFIIWFLAS